MRISAAAGWRIVLNAPLDVLGFPDPAIFSVTKGTGKSCEPRLAQLNAAD